MMHNRLDALLELTREAPPVDDHFVRRVVQRVRTDTQRRASKRTRITRTAAFAAAVLVVAGGAVAATMRSSRPDLGTRIASAPTRTDAERVPSSPDIRAADPRRADTGAPRSDEPSTKTFRRDHLEWGYTSAHTSFVADRSTGLRLETETFEVEVITGQPHRVSVTLENRGRRPIAISSPKDCATTVAAYYDEDSDGSSGGDPSAFRDPTMTRDADDASSWQCTEGGDPDNRETETFVLDPGERRVSDATIVLGQSGSWAVLSACRCTYAASDEPGSDEPLDPADPARHPDPFEELGRSGVLLPYHPPSPGTHEEDALFTPPIRVRAA